jgi:radical SAM superfamily enzyme YgiQ (UPF0313 family)
MKKNDILLVYPKPSKDSSTRQTPLSILFPGAYFKQQGLKVEYFDGRIESEEVLDEHIKNSKEIAVSTMTGFQCSETARILKKAKKMVPDIISAVGGPHVQSMPEQVMEEPFVDKIYTQKVLGEDLFPYDSQTHKYWALTDMSYLSSSGCPFPCTFCSQGLEEWKPSELNKFRKELTTIHENVGFKNVSLVDPNVSHGSYKEDGHTVKEDKYLRMQTIGQVFKDLDSTWECAMRHPDLTKRMIEILSTHNCTRLHLGAESGSEDYLRKVLKKGHGVKNIKQAALNLKGSGISVLFTFISYMPGETFEDMHKTMDLVDWINDVYPEARVTIYNYAPYPGTKLFDDAVAGRNGIPKFKVPKNMEEWSKAPNMQSPLYWIAGLNFRLDQSKRNFPGEDWKLIEPYYNLAVKKWKNRDIEEFPVEEVQKLVSEQINKQELNLQEAPAMAACP